MKKSSLLFVFIWLVSHLFAQYQVFPISAESTDKISSGVVYSLPKAVLQLEIEVECNRFIRGPFADYAVGFLGISDLVQFDHDEYQIESIKLNSFMEPDPNQSYLIIPDEKTSKEFQSTFTLDTRGVLSSFRKKMSINNPSISSEEVLNSRKSFGNLASNLQKPQKDSIVRKISLGKMEKEIKVFMNTFKMVDPKEKAREVIQKIERLRQNQLDLISGDLEVPYSVETIRYMDERISEMINQYLDLFRGAVISEKEIHTFYLSPEKETIFTICKFSEKFGVKDVTHPKGDAIFLKLNINESQALQAKLSAELQKGDQKGLYYKIPTMSGLVVEFKGDQILTNRLVLPQYSPIVQSTQNLRTVDLDPETGGIIQITN